MKVSLKALKSTLIKILSSRYYSTAEAEKIAEVFLFAELTGKNTQGLLKLMGTEPAQNIKPQKPIHIERKTNSSAMVDGGGAAGPLAAQIAVDEAITMATQPPKHNPMTTLAFTKSARGVSDCATATKNNMTAKNM
jgi:LDH2 family malate/lactate/ureidoglycolate dehydrogenase